MMLIKSGLIGLGVLALTWSPMAWGADVAPAAAEPQATSATTSTSPAGAVPDGPAQVSAAEVDAANAPVSAASREPAATGNEVASRASSDGFQALEADGSSDAPAATDPSAHEARLSFYGFADFTYQKLIVSTPVYDYYLGKHGSFYVGNLNLYADAELSHGWRSLAEVRFLYLPNGTAQLGEGKQGLYSTSTPDYADFERPLRWGGVEIERAWLEHEFDPLLSVRFGQWLTPWGIWNVDHGTPTIIGIRRPFIVGMGIFPERQTGIEAYGTTSIASATLRYHLTVSNGRGDADTYRDFDENKAIGARVELDLDLGALGKLALGSSLYTGKYTQPNPQLSITSSGLSATNGSLLRLTELALAGDARWNLGKLLVQGEVAFNQTRYPDDQRPFSPVYGTFLGDHREMGFYGLVGYRTPLWGIMPYGIVEYYDFKGKDFFPIDIFTAATSLTGGVNIQLSPEVVWKVQYYATRFAKAKLSTQVDAPLSFVDTQLSWAF